MSETPPKSHELSLIHTTQKLKAQKKQGRAYLKKERLKGRLREKVRAKEKGRRELPSQLSSSKYLRNQSV